MYSRGLSKGCSSGLRFLGSWDSLVLLYGDVIVCASTDCLDFHSLANLSAYV